MGLAGYQARMAQAQLGIEAACLSKAVEVAFRSVRIGCSAFGLCGLCILALALTTPVVD